MTRNQLEYWRNRETQRSNRAQETETNRANVARETETHRSNLADEAERNRHNLAVEAETHRSNTTNERQAALNANRNWILSLRSQAEVEKMNTFQRQQGRAQLAETQRANRANEMLRTVQLQQSQGQLELQRIVQQEVQRANQAREFTNQYVAYTNYVLGQQRNDLQKSQISETQRSNMASESIRRQQNSISQRNLNELSQHNRIVEAETMRSNLADEEIRRQVAVTQGVTNIMSSSIRASGNQGPKGGNLK